MKSDNMKCRITRADAKTNIASMGVQYSDDLYNEAKHICF